MRAARKRLIEELEADAPEASARGTIADVVARYLKHLPDGSYATDRAILLAPWVKAHGDVRFVSLTRAQILATLTTWEREGLSPTTRNHRLSALRVVWRTIATDDSRAHPCERVKRATPPKAERNRARPMALIQQVLAQVTPTTNKAKGADSHARHQLTLLAWTGQPSATLSRVRPADVRWDLTPPEVYLQPRRKGEGAQGRWIPLLPQAAAALRAWLALEVDGPWHRGTLRLAWQRAITKTQARLEAQAAKLRDKAAARQLRDDAGRLTGMRVYDLRHSFLTAMVLATGDAFAVSEYAQHSDIRTTMAYMQGASSARMRDSLAKFSATIAVPRAGATFAPLQAAAPRSKAQHSASRRNTASH